MESVAAAKARGLTVSCDLNYRKNLWKWGKKAHEVMPELFQSVDVGIANEEDVQLALGIRGEADVESGHLDRGAYEKLAETVLAKFPALKMIAITLRESKSASHNNWSACLHDRKKFHLEPALRNHPHRGPGGRGRFLRRRIDFRLAGTGVASGGVGIRGCRFVPEAFDSRRLLQITRGEVEDLIKGGGSGRVKR